MLQADIARRVAESAPSMLVYLDAELRVRFANSHCYELLGRAPREILGCLLAEMVDCGIPVSLDSPFWVNLCSSRTIRTDSPTETSTRLRARRKSFMFMISSGSRGL